MIKIQKLSRPTKLSGDELKPGQSFKKQGFTITNSGAGRGWFVDSVTPKKKARKNK